MLSASHQTKAPTQMRRNKRAAQWVPWYVCGHWSRLSPPGGVSGGFHLWVALWARGAAMLGGGGGLKCGVTDQSDHGLTCDPTGTISIPSVIWAHLGQSRNRVRSAGHLTHRPPDTVFASLYSGHAPKEGRREPFISTTHVYHIVLYYGQLCKWLQVLVVNYKTYLNILNLIPFLKLSHNHAEETQVSYDGFTDGQQG